MLCENKDILCLEKWFLSSGYSKNVDIKGALSCLRQLLATESSLKMTKNAFYFTLKAVFVLKIFKFLP